MTESTPPTLEQAKQLNRSLTEKVLDKAASDPQWKQRLLDDPEAALRAANFPETQQIQRMQEQAEVRGQHISVPRDQYSRLCHWSWVCLWQTHRWDYG